MSDEISKTQLQQLVKSSRAGFRLLACELAAYFELNEELELLYPLLDDPQAKVRAKLYQTLGRVRASTLAGHSVAALAVKGSEDPDAECALSAAWLLLLNDPKQGVRVLEKWVNHPVADKRRLAAAAIAASGKYGISLALRYYASHSDPYVRMNLALGLIGQRVHCTAAAEILYKGLQDQRARWMWREDQFFRTLAPSNVKHNEAIPDYPQAVNQLARLEIVQMLCLLKASQAQQALKQFLQEKHWEVSGLAAALLLTEGDESAIDQVRALLESKEETHKMQAALILALWGREEEVLAFLQEQYEKADRTLKGQILEGIGRVGSASSLPFLAKQLEEPYQSLRLIAAAAMLECLYH
jgi:HEAT repeat protein